MLAFFLACTPPQITVWGQMFDSENVEVEWAEMIYRSEETPWKEEWTVLPIPNVQQTLSTTPTLLTEHTLPEQSHVHLFTDAQTITVADEQLADIIEPIACPIPAFGNHQITITYIIIDTEIFAMDCIVQ